MPSSTRACRVPTTCCSRPAESFGDALAAVDLALSRAGGTVWELAATGTPSILVPYPHATADHQALNARHFEEGGGALCVRQEELARVPGLVDELLADLGAPARDGRRDARARPASRRGRDRGRAARAGGAAMIDVPVALLGYGTVGSAVHRLLEDGAEDIERATGHRLRVVRALVRDAGREREHTPEPGILTDDFDAVRGSGDRARRRGHGRPRAGARRT